MEYRNLGRTGLKVSEVCLGTMTFGRETDDAESLRILHAALDCGINFIDTADAYSKGRSEELVGQGLQGRRRDGVILATKVFAPMSDDLNDRGLSRHHVLYECDRQLRRLRTDHIDLYLLHRPDPSTPVEETLAALELLVQQGKVRYLGVSMFAAWQMMQMLSLADQRHWLPICNVQSKYSLLERGLEDEVIPFCLDQGVGLTAYSPLAGGVLTGKYTEADDLPPDTRAAAYPRFANMLDDRTDQIVSVCRDLAATHGAKPHHVALAWVRQRPGVTAAILGARSLQQFEDTAAGFDLALAPDELARLDEVSERPEWAK